jgi:hypothetical protein
VLYHWLAHPGADSSITPPAQIDQSWLTPGADRDASIGRARARLRQLLDRADPELLPDGTAAWPDEQWSVID